jgi:general secretion pathway protein F
MSRFAYQAFTAKGDVVRGQIEAPSQADALQQLRAAGLVAFQAAETKEPRKRSFWSFDFGLGSGRMTESARLAFVYELGILLRAQLPTDQALRLLLDQSELRNSASLVRSVSESVSAGKTLGEALADRTELLSEHETAIIRAAEHTGSVAETMLQLASSIRRRLELSSQIKAALTYPVILLVMSFLTIAIITTVLVPNLLPLFDGARTDPPLLIRIMLLLQDNIDLLAIALLVAVGSLWALWRRAKKNARLLAKRDWLMLRAPLFGHLIVRAEAARIASVLALLLKSGIPLLQALSVVQRACKNRAVKTAFSQVVESVASGGSLAHAFWQFSIMPQASCHLVAVGEEANRLDELLMHIAQMNEAALQQKLERLMTLLTPVLTLLMGLLVGGLIMSVMRAILSVNDLVIR